MARYVQMAGEGDCASCADIFPPEGGGAPAPGSSVTLPGGSVTVTVPGGEARRLPWWIWLAIGVGLGWIAND
jgi:hypothetical protein